MLFTFFVSLLLLATIGGISHPSTQALYHTLLTGCCLCAGWSNALNKQITFLCIVMMISVAIIVHIILIRQSFHRSLKELFIGLIVVILAISLVVHILPPSLFRLEYSVVFSIILIGILYSVSSPTLGGQIVGTLCALDALTLVIGLNSQFLAFLTLFVFYGSFLLTIILVTRRIGYYSS